MAERRRDVPAWALAAALAAATIALYWSSLADPFLDVDDNIHITGNPYLRAGLTLQGLRWAFFTFHSNLWYPLTWASHMADVSLFGFDPWGHHLTSLLLHAANAATLVMALAKLAALATRSEGRRPSPSPETWTVAFAAGLFALHPLRVESVAWAAERKDVLSGLFFLSSLWAYARYCERPSAGVYGLTTLLFTLGLMSKPMVVTLPAIFLAADHWLGRQRAKGWTPLLLEKLPLLALAAGVCALTMMAQSPFVMSAEHFPWKYRLLAAPVFYVQYVGKILWPATLSLYYPHPGPALSTAASALAAAALGACTWGAWRFRRRAPWAAAGWAWFLIGLVPVIGIVQITSRSIADRFTYLPQIGLCIAAAWGAATAVERTLLPPRGAALLGAVLLASLAARTRVELRYWRDPVSLYAKTLATAPGNELFRNVLGVNLAKRGDYAGARSEIETAIRIRPEYADAHNNLGLILAHQGRVAEAKTQYLEALRIDPTHPQAAENLRKLPN
ncbi:MAG: tetratricopeptide repeat protein [Elusimicrobia bacterium]|nr:tetratricopeptide repeat protein [Elusimicrobiota bacterium]